MRASSWVAGGTAEPPPPIVFTDERSNLPAATSGSCTNRCSTVSVIDQPVHCSRSMTAAAFFGSNRPIHHTLRTPVATNITAPVCRPDTWNSGLVMNWQGRDAGTAAAPASGSRGRRAHRCSRALEEQHRKERAHVAVRVHRALRPSRGAAREEQDGRVVGADGHVGERRVGVRGGEGAELVLHHDHRHSETLGFSAPARLRLAPRRALDTRDPLPVGDEQLRLRIADRVLDLRARPPSVQRARDRAETARGPERDDPVDAVRAQDRDTVALPHAVALGHHLRERRHGPFVLSERETARRLAVGRHEVLGVAEADRLLEQLPKVRRRVENTSIGCPSISTVASANGQPSLSNFASASATRGGTPSAVTTPTLTTSPSATAPALRW